MRATPGQEQLLDLIERLVEVTRAGKAKWRADSGLASFGLDTSSGSVTIASSAGDGSEPYQVTLFNRDGVAIEQIESSWIGEYEPAPWNSLVESLYGVARSNAIALDDVIGGILKEVEGPHPDDDIPF